jgi:hypothetical protein
MFLTGEFRDPQSAIAAVAALRAKGFAISELDLFSSEPVELPEGLLDRESHMSLAAAAGGVLLFLLATGFVFYTQYDYPLITGGMPLISFWATGVVSYELAMLGAIGMTFLAFLWESGLLRRGEPAPVPALDNGAVYLRVRCRPEQIVAAGECLYQAGASRVKRSEARL